MSNLSETLERKKAELFLNKYKGGIINYEFTDPGSFDHLDLFFTGKTASYCAEIKDRDCHIDLYPDYLLEHHKYEALRKEHNKGSTALFINFFSDGCWIVFNISERIKQGVDLRFRAFQLPTDQHKEGHREKLITKLVIRDYDQVNRSGVDLEPYNNQRELEIIRNCT